MDVTGYEFPGRLATILDQIAKARFVAFDLELSGIPQHSQRGKVTVNERYQELKAAANKYHILQVGITCIQEDAASRVYTTHAYNFNLNPLVDEKTLGLHRDFTYSSSAVEFLLRNGYQMQAPFINSVPWLDRAERTAAVEKARSKRDRNAIPNMIIKPGDTDVADFVDRIKREVAQWKKSRQPNKDFYHIFENPRHDVKENIPLTPFKRRLAHQTIRAHFPELQSESADHGVKVKDVDLVAQEKIHAELMSRINADVFQNTGFGWIAESLARGDLSGLSPEGMRVSGPQDGYVIGNQVITGIDQFSQRVKEITDTLSKKETILVGHNCFLDLVYFFNTFYGPLPDHVAEFAAMVHEKFPTLIDTKALASLGEDFAGGRNSQLFQLNEIADCIKNPVIESPHLTGSNDPAYHEAGFDSWSTARVFLRLAGMLLREGTVYIPEKKDESPLDAKYAPESPKASVSEGKGSSSISEEALELDSTDSSGWTQLSKNKRKRLLRQGVSREDYNAGRFAHPTVFSALEDMADDEDDEDDDGSGDVAEKPTGSASALPPDGGVYLQKGGTVVNHDGRFLLPKATDQFWGKFVNKLRVGGTKEEEVVLKAAHDVNSEGSVKSASQEHQVVASTISSTVDDNEDPGQRGKAGLLGGLLEALHVGKR